MSTEKKQTAGIYFPNLDALRFIAASLVVVSHIEFRKKYYDLSSLTRYHFFSTIGGIAVTLFFVISGFIITYLLMAELRATNRIDIPKFYTRRILRIWPLYYFVILLAYLVLRHISIFYIPEKSLLWNDLDVYSALLFLFFLSNVALVRHGNIPYIDQTWSIGSEEQFYIFWPFMVRKFLRYKYFFLTFTIFTIAVTNPFLTRGMLAYTNLTASEKSKISELLLMMRFSCMGIGGWGAYIYFHRERYTRFLGLLFGKPTQVMIYITVLIGLVFGFNYIIMSTFALALALLHFLAGKNRGQRACVAVALLVYLSVLLTPGTKNTIWLYHFKHELFAVLFCMILLNLANAQTSLFNLGNKILLYLGRISYGIYMYHGIFVILSLHIVTKVIRPAHGVSILIYLLTFALTIAASALSYKYLEQYFLRLKKRVTVIKSGADTD